MCIFFFMCEWKNVPYFLLNHIISRLSGKSEESSQSTPSKDDDIREPEMSVLERKKTQEAEEHVRQVKTRQTGEDTSDR